MVAFNVITKSLRRRTWLNQEFFVILNRSWKTRRNVIAFVRCNSTSEEHIVNSSYPPVRIPEMPIHEYLFQNIQHVEDRVALECVVTGKKVTYKEFYRCSKTLASSLQKRLNMKKGDCQFVLLPNCPEYPSILMAGSMVGAVTTTSNPLYTPYEISHQLEITQAKVIFAAPEVYGNCIEALNKLNKHVPIIIVKPTPGTTIPPGTVDFMELAYSSTPENPEPVQVDFNANAVLPFSSGTSGFPKAVELSHRNITANLSQIKNDTFVKNSPDTESNQTISLAILPMFHIYGMVAVAFESITSGDRLIILPKFDPKLLVDAIFTKKTGVLFLVPPLVFFLAHHPLVEKKHLENVKFVVTGASSCGVVDSEALKMKSPHILICQGYGMTETSPAITLTHRKRIHKTESVGHPLSLTQIKIVDLETGKSLPRGARGEICVKGPQVMKGYLNQPEITKNSFDEDGWLRTGDIGYCDEDNDFYVFDRIKELIKVKGFQVAPAELEETLRAHPKIYDAGVIGVPDPNLGEVPKAFIRAKPGVSLTEEEVMEFIKKKLAPHKQLKGGVTFIHAIPRNSAGKILRRKLKDLEKET